MATIRHTCFEHPKNEPQNVSVRDIIEYDEPTTAVDKARRTKWLNEWMKQWVNEPSHDFVWMINTTRTP